MNNENFKAALITPGAISCLYCDYLGINSVALPTLFNVLNEANIALLDCKTLHQILKKDIKESPLDRELQQVRQFYGGLEIFEQLGEDVHSAVSTLNGLDLKKMLDERFEQLYANAITMSPCGADDILGWYYAKKEPFGNVDDSFDVYDAFLLMTFIDYAKQHPKDKLLVISGDSNWREILQNFDNVVVSYSVENSLKYALKRKDLAKQLFGRLKQKVLVQVEKLLEKHAFCVEGCKPDADTVVEVRSVYIDDYEVFPLLLEQNKATYRLFTDLEVDGSYRYKYCRLHQERWLLINRGSSYAFLEVEITFDGEDIAHTAKLSNVKIINRGALPIYLRADADDDYMYDD